VAMEGEFGDRAMESRVGKWVVDCGDWTRGVRYHWFCSYDIGLIGSQIILPTRGEGGYRVSEKVCRGGAS
jgi:hypothetical protein